MKRIIIGSILSAVMLIVPGIASAHSGTVTCDSRGVVFTYNANFPTTTTVTQDVSGVTKTVTVPRNTATVDIMPFTAATVVASSTWVGGGTIPPTTLTCPYTAPPVPPCEQFDAVRNPECRPPTPPAINCAPGTAEVSRVTEGVNTTVLCERTVVPPVPPMPLCPKGTKNLGVKNGILLCQRTKIKVVNKTKIKWKTKLVEWCPAPPKKHKTPGVTG